MSQWHQAHRSSPRQDCLDPSRHLWHRAFGPGSSSVAGPSGISSRRCRSGKHCFKHFAPPIAFDHGAYRHHTCPYDVARSTHGPLENRWSRDRKKRAVPLPSHWSTQTTVSTPKRFQAPLSLLPVFATPQSRPPKHRGPRRSCRRGGLVWLRMVKFRSWVGDSARSLRGALCLQVSCFEWTIMSSCRLSTNVFWQRRLGPDCAITGTRQPLPPLCQLDSIKKCRRVTFSYDVSVFPPVVSGAFCSPTEAKSMSE